MLKRFTEKLVAYDFMVLQKFEVRSDQWFIQNIGIQQGFRLNLSPLSIEKAQAWFESAVQKQLAKGKANTTPDFQKLDQNTAKKYEKIFQARPQLKHLYIDRDFRLVKTQREAKQHRSMNRGHFPYSVLNVSLLISVKMARSKVSRITSVSIVDDNSLIAMTHLMATQKKSNANA